MTKSLYDPSFEHDACGVGMIADLTGRPSFGTIGDALTILENLEHRGAVGADVDSGDGAGILIQIPDAFLREILGVTLPDLGSYGVGQWMLSREEPLEAQQRTIEAVFGELGLSTLTWRHVPVDSTILGPTSSASEPLMYQQIIVTEEPGAALEARLYCARKLVEHAGNAYAASCSSKVLIYKGMLSSPQLRQYYDDLRDERLSSAIAVVHSRFSTNVLPRWDLAQPFRYIAHNGEINTVRGNRNWMVARETTLASVHLPIDPLELAPIVTPNMSDSASFDEVVELLVQGGRSLPHAVLMMIPEAWERSTFMSTTRRDFYRYHAGLMEPWDGPASVTFCDGNVVGAVLDRNGLRPARYWVTKDQRVIFASEVGVLPIDPANIERKGRLQPGRMFLVDLSRGRVVDDDELKDDLASRQPYGDWLDQEQVSLDEIETPSILTPSHATVIRRQKSFGFSEEDLRLIIRHMAQVGEEPIGSMGSDTALAALSRLPRSIFDYFTQLFAQVTNPPLDAIREELVTSTRVTIGGEGNLLSETAGHCRQVVLPSPILSVEELAKLRWIEEQTGLAGFRAVQIDALFPAHGPGSAADRMATAIDEIGDRVVAEVRAGANIVILSDRGSLAAHAAVPSLLVTSAVHHRLVQEHLRTSAALILEAGDVREVHHAALLLGFGASAVCPYLAYESIDALVEAGELSELDAFEARYQYGKSLNKGLVKIMSKMGVSTVASYVGSQLFEAVGLSDDVLSRYFPGFRSRVGGATLERVADDVIRWHDEAYGPPSVDRVQLTNRGEYQWRRDGELHLFNPRTVQKLQHATREKRYDIFKEYTRMVDEQADASLTLRALLEITPSSTPLALDDVESVASIVKRFSTGAMSYGSISEEAHTTLAIAMNRLGGKSNTGEGGEDAERFDTSDPRFNRRSAIKQVASGRFGVTSEYLVNADDLQIKMAQGAKPGEGGQLPGSKVYPWIAKTRHSTPGVGLISPPPHHDIYSIEDLAQLIYDLKNANDQARVHVKLVSEQGVGTIAAGVAKAHADVILISGHDGGTGAAPLTSLKHAGTPWELGLAEAHQTLASNGLRSRVVLQVDGQLKTGRDVIVAALLGAEEFGFASAPLVVEGCIMMRVCHLDTCPVGIATQNPRLRERFTGRPEFVENFFEFIAEEVREYLAALGVRTIDELIGDASRLRVRAHQARESDLDLSALLVSAPPDQRRHSIKQDHGLDQALDWRFLSDAVTAATQGTPVTFQFEVHNVNRAVGTLTGSAITRALGRRTLPDDHVVVELTGSSGQSLGAFIPRGLTLRLEGDTNDYAGKGLSGGRVIVRPPTSATFASEENIIAGNVIGYGATSGEIFIRGVVGERCGVRNSGATIVVEGAGDHAGEYMTGGVVVILGNVGRNLAAGMSGGTIYLYDPENRVHDHLSAGVYEIDPLEQSDDELLHALLERFLAETGSPVAQRVTTNWREERMNFVRIETSEYQRARDEQRNG
ncbi:MAG: glutamate synthase large subunit [Acidobacteriota bacterium]|nr:glutamate synthase large subunit [Acidobacteriota bacterium]MDE3043820.1 glutamate synthase large subunit [Acidobacteriota bacterium]MDE3106714.1 glutamate synthase large subunit [Acidobacteriota bacterium]MDE3223214.1 glutamate synthase large subunit [Acidobacteriota bacterium]